MFIQTEPTPNPAALKFLPGRTVLAHGTLDIRDKDAAAKAADSTPKSFRSSHRHVPPAASGDGGDGGSGSGNLQSPGAAN